MSVLGSIRRAAFLAGLAAAGCSANPLDPDEKGCVKTVGGGDSCGDTAGIAGAGNGAGSGNGTGTNADDPSNCGAGCANLAACVDLAQTALGDVDGCVSACRADATGANCLASAHDCAAVTACVQSAGGGTNNGNAGGGGTGGGFDAETCMAACEQLDGCTAGGLAAKGVTLETCVTGCQQGQLSTADVVACVAQATTCGAAGACSP